ncbi:MAG: chemotaxis-specific protein-glutamate methyltransferase CheB [Tepidisphaera sp.]|nr:chemotaxis-specific protein-glutamate methyltransferase CheB [Tepidisphaera sp.]
MGTQSYGHRVLVVDDSAFMRKAIPMLLANEPGLEVVGTARDGQDALDKIRQLQPDAVTLDIEMPVMDGLTALAKIMAMPDPRPVVIVCSTLTTKGSHEALKALRLGATDFITKDPQAIGGSQESFRSDLVGKLRAVLEHRPRRALGVVKTPLPIPTTKPVTLPKQAPTSFSLGSREFGLVLIGSSTGGPPILETVIKRLPQRFSAPVVVAQHMPALFTTSLATRLNEECQVRVEHADSSRPLERGVVYIVKGGMHGVIRRQGGYSLEITDRPTDALYKPSVDVLLGSAATPAGKDALGIVLTGMGADGAIGAKRLHECGGMILAQAAESCAVYGMPRATFEAGVTSAMLLPEQIGQALSRMAATGLRAA